MGGQSNGRMDITEQRRTFAGFVKVVAWAFVVVAGILLLLTTRI